MKNVVNDPAVKPEIFTRATFVRDGKPVDLPNTTTATPSTIARTQFTAPIEGDTAVGPPDPFVRPGQTPSMGGTPEVLSEEIPPEGMRRIYFTSRSSIPIDAVMQQNPSVPDEYMGIITSGITMIIDGLEGFGSIDLSTDRLVIWTKSQGGLSFDKASFQDANAPLEIYLEGNIVFRQGDRIIYADRMYYDVRRQQGTILNAEILSPVPSYDGLVRLRAQVLQQVNRDQFVAQEASVTSSRLGIPSYEFRAGQLVFQDIQKPAIDPYTGAR